MNVAMTLSGVLEEDEVLREVAAVLAGTARKPAAAETAKRAETDPAGGGKAEGPAGAEPETEREGGNPEPSAEVKTIRFEDVRSAASRAMNGHKRDGVTALLAKYGDGHLKSVAESDYPALLAEIETL